MSELLANCPRCKAQKMTFDLKHAELFQIQYDWQRWFEAFCVCRHCGRTTTFVLKQKDFGHGDFIKKFGLPALPGTVNTYLEVQDFISLKDLATIVPPEHLHNDVKNAFSEGAKCLSIGCYNAAGTMLRLCLDLSTRSLLPQEDADGLNAKTRRDLGLRLPWLFNNGKLPETLKALSSCVKEDGNDGAHAGTLVKEDAEDLLDFTIALLERIFTEPKRIELARERRDARREPKPR